MKSFNYQRGRRWEARTTFPISLLAKLRLLGAAVRGPRGALPFLWREISWQKPAEPARNPAESLLERDADPDSCSCLDTRPVISGVSAPYKDAVLLTFAPSGAHAWPPPLELVPEFSTHLGPCPPGAHRPNGIRDGHT